LKTFDLEFELLVFKIEKISICSESYKGGKFMFDVKSYPE